jgi:hypothetical protein
MLVTKSGLEEKSARYYLTPTTLNLKIPGILSVPSANPRKIAPLLCRPWLDTAFGSAEVTESRIFQKSALKGQL